ncbi:hypothetical protein GALL_482050 [mine drainage metagenome]|uniref:Uncharacterized protein n=1 Tax=mine drainage metagenome TaxID=410659 RepID=A0A1J5PG60_9ZZZZ
MTVAVGLVKKSNPATLLRTATVVRNRRDIGNHVDANTQSSKRPHRRFTSRARTLDFNIKVFDALLNRRATGDFRCNLSCKRC